MAEQSATSGHDDDAVAETEMQRTGHGRAWESLVFGEVGIAVAAIFGVVKTRGGTNATEDGSIPTSAFTAIGTMIAAYFRIRAAFKTAQSTVKGVAGVQSGSGPRVRMGRVGAANQTTQTLPQTCDFNCPKRQRLSRRPFSRRRPDASHRFKEWT